MARYEGGDEESEPVGDGLAEPEMTEEDDDGTQDDDEGAAAELWGLLANHGEAIEAHDVRIGNMNQRVESRDRTLFSGLRGIVMIMDSLEQATDPAASAEIAAKARAKVRDIIDTMTRSM